MPKKLSSGFWREVATNKLSFWAVAPAAVALFLILIGLTAYIVSRKLGHPIPLIFESSQEFLIIIFVIPAAHVAASRGHVFFDTVTRKFPERVQASMNAVASALGAGVFGFFTWGSWRVAADMVKNQEFQLGMVDYPIWPFRIILTIGFGLLTFQLIVVTIQELNTAWAKRKASHTEAS